MHLAGFGSRKRANHLAHLKLHAFDLIGRRQTETVYTCNVARVLLRLLSFRYCSMSLITLDGKKERGGGR